MYPLCSWTYSELCQRIELLEQHQLKHELVIASAQTLEQVFKRIVKQYMTKERKGYAPDPENEGKWGVIDLQTADQRDEILREHFQSMKRIKSTWSKLLKGQGIQPLATIIDQVCGNGTWQGLMSNKKITIAPHTRVCPSGLFVLRHKLVHGVHAPSEFHLGVMAAFGAGVVKKIMHPETGISQHVKWDVTKNISRWPKQP